ncbi:hypothetical protein ACP26E_16695 [Franconibacter pulveris 601]|uniref:hypothetical protein n=1 Tax=Franconibacter pulveris TaxID=435910 RepID=UPI00190FAB39|nr:hypothetical protein [Franconibacter pulveris]
MRQTALKIVPIASSRAISGTISRKLCICCSTGETSRAVTAQETSHSAVFVQKKADDRNAGKQRVYRQKQCRQQKNAHLDEQIGVCFMPVVASIGGLRWQSQLLMPASNQTRSIKLSRMRMVDRFDA